MLEKYIRLRNEVIAPYVQELAKNVTARGVVTMRSLTYEFPNDAETYGTEDSIFRNNPSHIAAV